MSPKIKRMYGMQIFFGVMTLFFETTELIWVILKLLMFLSFLAISAHHLHIEVNQR